ncbi:MAG: hypothetical protein Q9209_007592 [Squamulea sp. 1 TL-2023]
MEQTVQTPASDNLQIALSFRHKKAPPQNVTYIHSQQPLQAPPQMQQQQQAPQPQLPTNMIADPVRHSTWGPKTVYYVDNLSESESSESGSKKKTNIIRKVKKDKEDVKFQKVVLNGSEQMQTTEKTEVLGLEQGGGVRKTWVCQTTIVVVSVEKEVEGKDVVVESGDEWGEREGGRKGGK